MLVKLFCQSKGIPNNVVLTNFPFQILHNFERKTCRHNTDSKIRW